MGQPVAGNPAQYIMEKAIAAAGLDLRFLTLEVAPTHLADAVRGVRAMGFRGAVLCPPHQAAVVPHVDELTDAARLIGEVDLLNRDGDRLIGDHALGQGLLRLLRGTMDPAGKQVVILGAGRAARALAVPLALAGAGEILIVNRTAESGQQLVRRLTEQVDVPARFVHWVGDFAVPQQAALVVQATSLGTGDWSASLPLNLDGLPSTAVVIDVRLNPKEKQFLRDASALGLAALDGVDLMVSHSAIAFHHWTGMEPDQGVMHEALEEFLCL
jgi:shikimate dehydrogenase